MTGPLDGFRVLDLATPWAEMAGRLLADLGADVIKIEPPGGAAARAIPPFDERLGHGGQSLYWAAVGMGKRSLVLDLEREDDRDRLRSLAAAADILVESFSPGAMERHGLGYRRLAATNRALIYVSVTPYGADGPKADWPATELTVEAASGRMASQGDGDRPPLPLGYPQAAFHAGAQAACDAIVALNERERSGLGQFLDVSAQAAMTWTLMDATGYPPLTGADPPGGGDDRATPPLRAGFTTPVACRDGFVVATIPPHQVGPLLPGMLASVGPDVPGAQALAGEDFTTWAERSLTGGVSPAALTAAGAVVAEFISGRTKGELHAWASANRVRLAPINTLRDVLDSPQHRARGFWREVGSRLHPGSPARVAPDQAGSGAPAPELDEGRGRVAWPRVTAPLPGRPDAPRPGEAFRGLRVADFTWVAAGPLTAKAFADHGATVVKIETGTRPDLVRVLPPFLDNVPGLNRSQWMGNVSSSKLGVTLNLATPEGRAIARRIALEWADVVMDSYTPGTMRRFGLDYASLSAERPDIICFSTCLMGAGGPLSAFGGFGNHGAAIAGMTHLTGWPDRPPAGPSGPYSDIVTPRFAVAFLAAAVLERGRTGRGRSIDLSQVECAVRFLEPLVLDAAVNGRVAGPAGHHSLTACPSGVYAAAGTERYVAVAVETPEQWRSLRDVLGIDEWGEDEFGGVEGRRAIAGQVDERIARWVGARDAFDAERELCAAGVPAAVVQRASDLHRDPQLGHRGFFVPLVHAEMGRVPYDGFATRFSARAQTLRGPAPLLGEHTEQVLREVLGMDDEAIAEAAAAGALS